MNFLLYHLTNYWFIIRIFTRRKLRKRNHNQKKKIIIKNFLIVRKIIIFWSYLYIITMNNNYRYHKHRDFNDYKSLHTFNLY